MTSLSIVLSTSAQLWIQLCLWAPACCESLCMCVCSVLFMLFCSSVHHLFSSEQLSMVKWCVGVRHSNGSITPKIRLFLLTEHGGALFSPNVVKVMIHSAFNDGTGLHNDTIMIMTIQKLKETRLNRETRLQ